MAKHSLTFYNNGVTLRKYGGTASEVDWCHKRFLQGRTNNPNFMEGNLVLVRKQNARKYVCGRFTINKDGVIEDVSYYGENEKNGIKTKIVYG